jgi:hypothetical protein
VDGPVVDVRAPWPRRGVYRLPDNAGWMVPSRTHQHAYWHVNFGHTPTLGTYFTCGCPAGQTRGPMAATHGAPAERPCHHVLEASLAEQADGIPNRPPARIDPEVFS